MKRKPPLATTPFSAGVCQGDTGFSVAASPRPAISFMGAKRQVAVASKQLPDPEVNVPVSKPRAPWRSRGLPAPAGRCGSPSCPEGRSGAHLPALPAVLKAVVHRATCTPSLL